MTVKEVIKQLKKMPQDIPVFIEALNPNKNKWGNHNIDLISHHYHENEDGTPSISECIFMIDYDKCFCGILKDDGTYMTDEELRTYFTDIL